MISNQFFYEIEANLNVCFWWVVLCVMVKIIHDDMEINCIDLLVAMLLVSEISVKVKFKSKSKTAKFLREFVKYLFKP